LWGGWRLRRRGGDFRRGAVDFGDEAKSGFEAEPDIFVEAVDTNACGGCARVHAASLFRFRLNATKP